MSRHYPNGQYGNWPLNTTDFAAHVAEGTVEAGMTDDGNVHLRFVTEPFGREVVIEVTEEVALDLVTALAALSDNLNAPDPVQGG